MSGSIRRPIALVLLWAVVIGAVWLAGRSLGLEPNPASVRDFVHGFGAVGPVVIVILIVLRLLFGVPSQVILMAAGLCFGVAAGTLYGAAGLTLSASIMFGLARWTGREAVERRLPRRARSVLDVAASRMGAALLVAGTGYPVGPMTVYHAVAGLTVMTIPVFLVAVSAGATIRALILTSFGSSLVEGSWGRLVCATAVLTAVIVAPLLFARSRRWLLATGGRVTTRDLED